MAHAMRLSSEMRECLRNCQECHAICTETAQHCLKLGGKHADPDHLRVLADCAQICQTSADFLLRSSDFHIRTCGVCAEICSACADSCERIAKDDEMVKRCVQPCRTCADSCERMARAKAA